MMNNVIGLGETVFDIIFKNDVPQAAIPGGSTFNAMVSLGRLNVPCSIITEVGDDHVGDITCQYLRDNGVDDKYVLRHKGTKSHVSLAFLDDKNDAKYQFYKDHANVNLNNNLPNINHNDVVLFGSFFAINPVIRAKTKEVLEKAHKAGAFLYYDINFRASHIDDIPLVKDNIKENYSFSSVVRGSLEDFSYLYGIVDVDQIYEIYIKPYCDIFICTDAGNPIQVRTPKNKWQFPVECIETVSTVGAGDNFNAGFIYALCNRETQNSLLETSFSDWKQIILCAQSFSANVCKQLGNSISSSFADSVKRIFS